MSSILDPSTPSGTVILGILTIVGAAAILAAFAWLFGPLKWPFQKRLLRKIILSDRHFRFVFNPDANRSKIVTFRADGEIGEGQNNNENRWRIKRGKLEILGHDGKLYSRFSYDQKTGRLAHTNDPDCRSILGQYFTPLFVPLGTQSRTNDDEVNAIASYLSRGAHSFQWFRRNTDFNYSDKKFNKIVYNNPDFFKPLKIVKRDKDGGKSRAGLPGMKLTVQARKQKSKLDHAKMRWDIILPALAVLLTLLTFLFGSGVFYRLGKFEKDIHATEENVIVPEEKEKEEISKLSIKENSDSISPKNVTIDDKSEKQKTSTFTEEPSTKKISKKDGAYIPPINIKSYKLTYSSRLCNFDIVYPQIYGLADEAFQSLMNDYILQKTNIKSIDLGSECEEYEKELKETKSDRDFPFTWNVDYKVHFNRNGILSLTVETYEGAWGGHGIFHKDSFNFDLNEATMIGFGDLFAFQYKEKIYDLLKERVRNEGYDESEAEAFDGVYLTENDIVVFYGMYKIAGGAGGVIDIPIPIRSVKHYLDPKGPLAKVISW